MDVSNMSRPEVIKFLTGKGYIHSEDRLMKNTGRIKECIYVDGSLAAKETNGGMYKLCNEFSTMIVEEN